jgi:hypothetical protein
MIRLQAEMLNLILRMANEFPQRKEQLIFIINNYDLMLSVLTVRKSIVLIAYHIDRTGSISGLSDYNSRSEIAVARKALQLYTSFCLYLSAKLIS